MSSPRPAKAATEPEPSRIWRWIGPLAALAVFGGVAWVLHREVVPGQGFCSLTSGIGLATLGGLSLLLEPQQLHDAVRLPIWWTRIVGTALLCLVVAYAVCSVFVRRPLELRGWQLRIPRPSIS